MVAVERTETTDTGKESVEALRRPRVAYIMSRFPKLTETFILFEMLAMREQGVDVEVYPLLRERTDIMHREAAQFVEQAHFVPFVSWPVLRANVRSLRRKPRAYLSVLRDLLKGNFGSRRYFTRALALFPKSVYFAEQMEATDVTHVHAHFASHPAAAAYVVHRLTDIPFSFTAHGSDIHRDRTMLAEKVAEASFVVSISEFNKGVILDACQGQFREKQIVIHCGVDTDHFRPRSAENNGQDIGIGARAEPLALCCIGTLHEVKGQHILIEACRQLRNRNVDFHCHFIGDGPDRAALTKQSADAALSGQITFHGQQTRTEVARLLQDTDVVVAPSVPSSDGRREGIPVALMEAMATGTPVVASRLSGIPELVEDEVSGLLIPPGDTLSLADALESLWLDPALRSRLGQAARRKILNDFDLYKNADLLAQQFNHGDNS